VLLLANKDVHYVMHRICNRTLQYLSASFLHSNWMRTKIPSRLWRFQCVHNGVATINVYTVFVERLGVLMHQTPSKRRTNERTDGRRHARAPAYVFCTV